MTKRAQRSECQGFVVAVAVGGAIKGVVVQHDQGVVQATHVDFNCVYAERNGMTQAGQGVFRAVAGGAAVAEYAHGHKLTPGVHWPVPAGTL